MLVYLAAIQPRVMPCIYKPTKKGGSVLRLSLCLEIKRKTRQWIFLVIY